MLFFPKIIKSDILGYFIFSVETYKSGFIIWHFSAGLFLADIFIYVEGNFLNASLDKSSDKNERNIILIEDELSNKYIVTQIAGLIARRIICDLKVDQRSIKGHRFGIIKFGSRVDLYMPLNTKTLVSVGQTVIGGETIISNMNKIDQIKKFTKI